MPKPKVTLKARLGKAYRDGVETGFKQGRQEAERLHAAVIAEQRRQMRAELARDANLARFETVTKGMQTMFSAFGQAIDVLSGLDGRID